MAIDRYKRDGTVLDGYQDLISAYTAAYPDGDATASEILLDGTDTTQTGGTDTTQTGGTDTTTGALTNLGHNHWRYNHWTGLIQPLAGLIQPLAGLIQR